MQNNRILVAYATNSGTTTRVAESIAEEIRKNGTPVDVLHVEEVKELTPYSAVVIGGPMILGWHKAALKFIEEKQAALSLLPVAYFITAKSLTQTFKIKIDGVPLCIDPTLAKPPRVDGRLSFRERYALPQSYVRPILKAAPAVKPVSIAFFEGKLELARLSLWHKLFVLFLQVPPGGSHNLPFIQEWAAGLPSTLLHKA